MATKFSQVSAQLKARKPVREDVLQGAAEVLMQTTKRMLNHPGSGRWYKSAKGDGTMHQASAPGEPPAPDRTNLRESIHVEKTEKPTQRRVVAGPHEGAVKLEFGKRSENLEPRPYMRPSLEEAKPFMRSAVVTALKFPGMSD